jgi:hypothetical protein
LNRFDESRAGFDAVLRAFRRAQSALCARRSRRDEPLARSEFFTAEYAELAEWNSVHCSALRGE